MSEANGSTGPPRCRIGTTSSSATNRGRAEDTCGRPGAGDVPYYSLANGFLSGKYRSKDDLGQSPRGLRIVDFLEGKGPRVLAAMEDVRRDGAAMATVALAWLKAQPGIPPDRSATSIRQMDEWIAA